MKALLAAVLMTASFPASAETPQISGNDIVSGFEPHIEVAGLSPDQRVRVHAIRMFTVWEPSQSGVWQPVPKPMHGWADFVADSDGIVKLWLTSPLAGTYAGIDGYGLLWSAGSNASKDVDPFLPLIFDRSAMKDGETEILLSYKGAILATAKMVFELPANLRIETVAQGRLNGVYAAPADGKKHPALILLHGSEGGSREGARAMAVRFAGQGYAAFAFNYFAWDLAELNGVPNAHVNQPIEMIGKVRDWLQKQPEADAERLGLYGYSKGAEYAEVAAVRLPWIKAVAACVPTDIVWQGYGIGDGRNRVNSYEEPPVGYSSFSMNGKPLPYVPLEGDRSGYHSNTEFYEAKRAEYSEVAHTAAIRVEKAQASFLWLGGGRDEVWASGKMAQRLDQRLRAHGADERSELHVYDKAGHSICGDGTYPTRLWAGDTTDPRDPDRDADGRATVDAWKRIKDFFARKLG